MERSKVGFAVIYRWRLQAGMEEQFRQAWKTVTMGLKAKRGALGSRLHLADDGIWIAYAQWPDRGTWELSRKLGPWDSIVSEDMQRAITESYPPILLDPVCDLLI